MPEYAQFESLAEFESFYRDEIVPAVAADPDLAVDPERETPPYRWLKGNYSGFVERLRREFDVSPGEFYRERGIPEGGAPDSATWRIDDEPTVDALDAYIEELRRDRGRAETTIGPRRSRLNTYVGTYRSVHGTGDLLSPVREESRTAEEIRRLKAVFRVLDDELGTLASKRKYVSAVQNWYTFLVETGRAAYDPTLNLRKRFGWDREPQYDHPALSTDDVAALLDAATTDERFLLLALVGWGLRPVEACRLDAAQFVFDPPDGEGTVPYVEFAPGERKNARQTRNTVELLVGVEAVRSRLERQARLSAWNGHLFPSPESPDSPITTQTARRWLRDLGDRADVSVDGDLPKPKMGRRTWYRLYRQQRPEIDAGTAAVAASQGSHDESVSERNYLDERTRRQARADAMRELVTSELGDLFDSHLPR